jgi:hypothetical protein
MESIFGSHWKERLPATNCIYLNFTKRGRGSAAFFLAGGL